MKLPLPWEQTPEFIRSGHRDPSEFEPHSLRTITLSEEEGIKAVIGKLEGKATTEVVSYLFERERGWTLEKAKAWFREHEARAKERFGWPGSVEAFPSGAGLIRGKALHPIKTVHSAEWPDVRVYLEEELARSAPTLRGKPLLLDHFKPLHGEVLNAEYQNGAIEYIAMLKDPDVLRMIENGDIQHCSVELEWRTLENVNGVAPRGIMFTGLSLLKDFEPGDPLSSVEIWESLARQLKESVKASKKPLSEAIAPPTGITNPCLSDWVSREEVLRQLKGITPERVPAHWGYGPFELVRKQKELIKKLESRSL